MAKVRPQAETEAEERILDALLPPARPTFAGEPQEPEVIDSRTRQIFHKKLQDGELDDKEIEIEVSAAQLGLKSWRLPAWRK